jgi:hypothetical protein
MEELMKIVLSSKLRKVSSKGVLVKPDGGGAK